MARSATLPAYAAAPEPVRLPPARILESEVMEHPLAAPEWTLPAHQVAALVLAALACLGLTALV